MSEKTIIRREHNKTNPYAQISRKSLQNPALSWKAKGLLAYLLSLPSDWQIYVNELPNHSKDRIKATRSAFKELIAAGHITGSKRRSEKGYFLGHEYIVHESPQTQASQQSHPRAQKRHADKGTLLNKDLTGPYSDPYHDLTKLQAKDSLSEAYWLANQKIAKDKTN